MKILFLGDIVGKLGRQTVNKVLPELKKNLKIDLVIANGENLAHGKGVTLKTLNEAQSAGIDLFTSGNHIWQKKEAQTVLEKSEIILRPANYPPGVPGQGFILKSILKQQVLIINLIGRVFMKQQVDCPFRKFDEIIKKFPKIKNVIIDFHAEATSEKQALAWYVKDRAALLCGTHTHIPTADLRIMNDRLGYITDIGMVGARDSILGVEKDVILKKFLTALPEEHKMVDKGPAIFNAIFVEIKAGKTIKIQRIDREIN